MIKTRFLGVYRRESASRKHAGKPDVCFYITFKNASGRKVWEKIGWSSEGYSAATASERRARRIQELRDGKPIQARKRRLTFAAGYEFFSQCLPDTKWARTVRAMWVNHILPRLGQEPMETFKAPDAAAFRDEMLSSGLSPQTVRHVLGSLRRMYKSLSESEAYNGKIPPIRMPRVDSERLRYLTRDEAGRLLSRIKERSMKWWRISLISLHTGMRLSEVLTLRAQDVDVAAGVINVKDAKTGTRPAYLTQTAAVELAAILPASPGDLVFPSKLGGITRDSSDTYDRTVKELGLNDGITDRRDRVVFHTLRHTFASWAVQRGVALEVLAKLLGHSTLEMSRRYAKFAPDQKRAAMERIEEMWSTHCP